MSAYTGIAILFLIVFLVGIMFGIFVIVSWSSNREDKKHSLSGPPPAIGARAPAGSWESDAVTSGVTLPRGGEASRSSTDGGRPMNPFEAVAIIIAVFFIAGLMVGFLIVMALPALVGRRSSDRMGLRRGDGQRGEADEQGTGGHQAGLARAATLAWHQAVRHRSRR